jgi:hypothetical protein
MTIRMFAIQTATSIRKRQTYCTELLNVTCKEKYIIQTAMNIHGWIALNSRVVLNSQDLNSEKLIRNAFWIGIRVSKKLHSQINMKKYKLWNFYVLEHLITLKVKII